MKLELVPVKYSVGLPQYQIFIENRGKGWAITMGNQCMGKDGRFDIEPQLSSRDDDFFKKFRFETKEEAFEFLKKKVEGRL